MECLVFSTIYLKSDAIRYSFEKLKPFFNIQEQDSIYSYRVIIILKMLFVFHTIKSIFPSYANRVIFTTINAYIFCNYRSIAILPVSVQWFLFFSRNKKFAHLASMVLICVIAMNVKSYEFILDLHVVVFIIKYAYKTYHYELQKLWTVVSIMITIGWYINNLRIFSLRQLSLLVIFLLLAYIPLKPDKHRHRILYFYILVLMWIIYKFQSVHFREMQTQISNFELHKRSGYYKSKSISCNDESEEKLVKILQNSKVSYISQKVIPEISLISNVTFLNANQDKVCRINDEDEKKLWSNENNIFEVTQLADDGKDNLLNVQRKVKDGYKSRGLAKHLHFKERKFLSAVDTNEIDIEDRDVGMTFKKTANTPIYDEYLNEIGIPMRDESIRNEQMLIDGKYRSRIEKDKNFVESINTDLLLLNKNSSIKERRKIVGKKAEEKIKKLMLNNFKDENNLESLKSTEKVAKFINEQKSSITLDEELYDILDSTPKEGIKKTKQIKSTSSVKETLVAGKKRNFYGPILDYEKSEVYNNKPVKGRPNIDKMGYTSKVNMPSRLNKYVRNRLVIAKESKLYENNLAVKARRIVTTENKRETVKSTIQEGSVMFQFKTNKAFTRKNNFRSELNRRENGKFDTFIKQLVDEFLQIKSDMQNRIKDEKKKMQEDEPNLQERFKFVENIELTGYSKIDGSRYPDTHNHLKIVKDSKKNLAENVIESRISENFTKDRGRKTYTLESLLKTVQYPMSYKEGKFKHIKNKKLRT